MILQHIKYPKIKRLGDEDVDGILLGTVFVQEKIDGANTSIWLNENSELKCGTRTQTVTEGFNGFVEYVKAHEGIKQYLLANPTHRLYGEWLVRHTIAYDETVYKQFYLFDILDVAESVEVSEEEKEEADRYVCRKSRWLTIEEVQNVGNTFGIKTIPLFATLENPDPDSLQQYVGKTNFGEKGEGVVLRNPEFINKWGDRSLAKIVTQEFKEDNAITFGGNNKHSETYIEMKIVNEFITLARVQKIMNKIQPLIDKRLSIEHTGRIIETTYHDMFVEEMWGIAKKHKLIDFGSLKNLAAKKASKIYQDILNGHISVAYEKSDFNNGTSSLGENIVVKGTPETGTREVEEGQ